MNLLEKAVVIMVDVMILVWFLALVVTHELGHVWRAKKEGIYKGFGFLPALHVKLSKPFKKRTYYLDGIFFSFLTLPLYLVVFLGMWSSFYIDIVLFFVFCFAMGIWDMIPFIWYNKLVKENVYTTQ